MTDRSSSCLEDLHWAEPTMLDLVEYVAAFARGPIVLLCIARPSCSRRDPSLGAAKLELEQLADAEIEELVAVLGVKDDERSEADRLDLRG